MAAERPPTIIVTGVGAIIGYGIIQCLRRSAYASRIVGIDIFADAVGRVWCDEFVQGVRADSNAFPDFIAELARRTHASLIIPGIEQDVRALDCMRARGIRLSCQLALNTHDCIALFDDKAETTRFLRAQQLPAIPTILPATERLDLETALAIVGLPCILKQAISYAGKGQQVLATREELRQALDRNDGVLIQRYVGQGEGVEYTASVFGLGDGEYVNLIVLERKLGRDGATAKAKTAHDDEIVRQVRAICAAARPLGPTNFQFIREPGGPIYLLEVNPRISSATSIREKLGINEAEMCVELFLLGRTPANRSPRAGSAQRFIDEVVEYDRDHE